MWHRLQRRSGLICMAKSLKPELNNDVIGQLSSIKYKNIRIKIIISYIMSYKIGHYDTNNHSFCHHVLLAAKANSGTAFVWWGSFGLRKKKRHIVERTKNSECLTRRALLLGSGKNRGRITRGAPSASWPMTSERVTSVNYIPTSPCA